MGEKGLERPRRCRRDDGQQVCARRYRAIEYGSAETCYRNNIIIILHRDFIFAVSDLVRLTQPNRTEYTVYNVCYGDNVLILCY
jgi:hypothetical protein